MNNRVLDEDTIIECDLESTEVDLQLSRAIQMLEKASITKDEWAVKLRNWRRHSRELFGEYHGMGFIKLKPHYDLEKQLLRLAYSVEDITCSFLCRREMHKKRQQVSHFHVFFNSSSNIRRLFTEAMKKAMDDFTSFTFANTSILGIQDYLFAGNEEVPGRLYSVCTCEEKPEDITIYSRVYNLWGYVSILGDAQVSTQTTGFARNIYQKAQRQMEFQLCAWVTLSPEYKCKDVFKEIYTAIVEQQEPSTVYNYLGVDIDEVRDLATKLLFKRVKKWLRNCSFIIVLDDVGYCMWSEIKSDIKLLFPTKTGRCSTVIFTTSDVVQASELTRVIEVVKPLSFKEALAVFTNTLNKGGVVDQVRVDDALIDQRKAQKDMVDQVQADDDALINRTEKLLRKMCTELPLEVTMLPRLYLTNKYSSYKEEEYSSSSTIPTLIIWDWLYQTLPPRIRLCYLYMGLFPQAYEIPIRRLIRLWIVELLVLPDLNPSKKPEDLALSYVMELEKRQLISVQLKNGHPKTCHIPSDMHKFCSTKAMDLGIFHVPKSQSNNSPSKFSLTRLAEHDYDIGTYPVSENEDLLSYISFNRKRDTPAQEVGVFLEKLVAKKGFGLLRVLDLESVYKPSLPGETIEKLFLLTYLGLRWTFLDSLPDSVGTLQCLEILDVKHTNINRLPSTIWKAKNLKHIYMNQVHFDVSIKKGFTSTTSLTSLQTLWGLSIGSNPLVVEWLSKLSSLRKLGLTYHPSTGQEIANSVSNLANLQSLRLRSIDELGQPSDLKLPKMTELDKLSELNLMGELSHPSDQTPNHFKFPPNLKALTLTGSKLIGDDQIRELGKLTHLNILRFYGHSYSGSSIFFCDNEFPQLVVMKLWMLEKLEELEIQKGAMSNNFQELDIRCCPNLKHIKGLVKHQLGGLRKITLTNMPANFVEKVESEANKDHVRVQVQKLNLSPISTTTR